MVVVLETDKPTLSSPKKKDVYFTRMASKYFGQLSDFIIPVTQLRLIETIGQGIHVMVIVGLVLINNHKFYIQGNLE